MNFEQVPSEENRSPNVYEIQGLQGPALDFEKIFNASNQHEALEENPQAKDFYDEVMSVVDDVGDKEDYSRSVIRAIRRLTKQKQNEWQSYDDVNFDVIREELQKFGVPLKPKKQSRDIQ